MVVDATMVMVVAVDVMMGAAVVYITDLLVPQTTGQERKMETPADTTVVVTATVAVLDMVVEAAEDAGNVVVVGRTLVRARTAVKEKEAINIMAAAIMTNTGDVEVVIIAMVVAIAIPAISRDLEVRRRSFVGKMQPRPCSWEEETR